MDNLGENELMNSFTRWMMLVQQELMMSLREMEGTEVMEGEGREMWILHSFGS